MKRFERKKSLLSCLIIMMLLVFIFPVKAQTADPLDTWYWRNPLPQGNTIQRITYGNGIFVALGYGGVIMTSPDGANWVVRRIPLLSSDESSFTGVAFGNGIFVGVGAGNIGTSQDGITWVTTNKPDSFRNVNYVNGMFIAVGQAGTIVTSTDGLNWMDRESGTSDNLDAVAYGKSIYVIVGSNLEGTSGTILTSTDGITWTPRSSGTAARLCDVTFGNETFVAVGDPRGFYSLGQGTETVVLTSIDGIDWSRSVRQPAPDHSFTGVTFANGNFYISDGCGHGSILFSSDGANWTARNTSTLDGIVQIYYNNGTYIAAGLGGVIQTSTDAISWTLRTTGTTAWFNGVSYGNGTFVAVGSEGIYTSADGVGWLLRKTIWNFVGAYGSCVTYGGGIFVAAGENGQIFTSPDGVTWTARTSGTTQLLHGVTYGNGIFVVVGVSGTILTSPDGATWTVRESGDMNYLRGIAYGNGTFVAVGGTELGTYYYPSGNSVILSSSDGITWTRRTTDAIRWLGSVIYEKGVFVVGGGGGQILTSADGINWTTRMTETAASEIRFDGDINGIAYGNGIFIAAGYSGRALISSDGFVWVSKPMLSRMLHAVTYGNGTFVAVGASGTIIQSGVMDTHEIIATADPNGTISPAGSVRVTNGESQTFTIAPNAGSQIGEVFVDGESLGTTYEDPYSYTFENVTADHTIRATFTGGKQLTGLVLSGSPEAMTAGGTQTLAATATYSDGSSEAIANADALWTSLDTAIASVGQSDGIVLAVAAGTTSIAAVYQGVTGNLELTVGSPPTAVQQHRGNLILVAGGGINTDNAIKEATLYLTDLVYSRFKSRFFSDADIYYYRPISWVDLNGDGLDDGIVDVNLEKEEFSVADFGQRITQWAANQSSDGPLYIYLIDHGGIGSFELYPYQILLSEQLNNYLNVFQERTGRQVVVIIEACKSGSLISGIVQPGQNRIVVTSAGRGEDDDSYMALGGRISFTQFFIDRFSAGASLDSAYRNTLTELADLGIPYSVMQPQLEEGIALASSGTYLGGEFAVAGLYPGIINQTLSSVIQAGTLLTLSATLSSLDRVTSVWAVIMPPNYEVPTASDDFQSPDVAMPIVKLVATQTARKFEGIYSDFRISGDYTIRFYAATSNGHVSSSPAVTIKVTGEMNLSAPGDINNDKFVNLADAILGLQIVAGMNISGKTIVREADVNGDQKIGLAEALYALQCAARLRNNHEPVMNSVGDQIAYEGALLSFNVTATDEDRDSMTYMADGMPAGAQLNPNTGAFTWTPAYNQDGVYPVTFRVSDDYGGSALFSIAITVIDVNRMPVLNPIGNKTVNQGSLVSFTTTATDPDGDAPLTYYAYSLPYGATFYADTRTFTWTPESTGTYEVMFTVLDGRGGSDSETVTITVNALAISALEYFPLNIGDWMEYRQTSTGNTARTSITGPKSIGGVSTKEITYWDGEKEYYTSDANGIRLYGQYIVDPDYTGDVYFTPPLLLMLNNTEIGKEQVSNSSYSMNVSGYLFTVNVTSTTTVLGIEDVQTATKVLKDCAKVSMRLDGYIVELQQYVSGDTVYYWLGKGVGVVKQIENSDTFTITRSSISGVQQTY